MIRFAIQCQRLQSSSGITMSASQDIDFVIEFFTELSKTLIVQRSIEQSTIQTVISKVLDVFFLSSIQTRRSFFESDNTICVLLQCESLELSSWCDRILEILESQIREDSTLMTSLSSMIEKMKQRSELSSSRLLDRFLNLLKLTHRA